MAPNSHDASHDAMMGGLIRHGLGVAGEAARSCPDPDIFAAYYERSLDATESAQFETHLSTCARCREQVAAMVRADEQPAPATRRLWFWDWRLIGAAVTALLVLTIWGVRRSTLSPVARPNPNQPLVAMSRPSQDEMQPAAPLQSAPAEEAPATEPAQVSPRTKLKAPEAPSRIVPKSEPGRQNEPSAGGKLQAPPRDLKDLPLNGRNFQKLDQLQPANPPIGTSELKKEMLGERAPTAPSVSTPSPKTMMAAPAARSLPVPAPNQVAGGSGSDDENSKANFSATDATQAKQVKSPFGAITAGAVAQTAEQRRGTTIIQTPDPKILWRIAGGNFVERTEDGGATWRGQAAAPDAQLTAGSAPANKTCWLVGKSGMIVVTKDTQHWKKLPPPVPADFIAVTAKNGSSAVVTAADGQKFSTENEGKKWVPAK